MFCKNCGKEIKEGDLFCGECGTPVGGQNPADNGASQKQNQNTYKVEVQMPAFNLEGCQILKLLKIYFTRPLSFFKEFKECDNVKTAAAMTIALPFIYAVLNMIYTSTIVSAFFSGLKKIPEFLAKADMISFEEAIRAQAEMSTSKEFYALKGTFKELIDYKKIFGSAFLQMLGIIAVIFIIIAIINAVMLKNKIKVSNIFFVASVSFMPFVLSVAAASIINFISILCGVFIIASGYILSFITLYNGVKELGNEKEDKIFFILVILFVLISIITAMFITKQAEASLLEIKHIFSSVEDLI